MMIIVFFMVFLGVKLDDDNLLWKPYLFAGEVFDLYEGFSKKWVLGVVFSFRSFKWHNLNRKIF